MGQNTQCPRCGCIFIPQTPIDIFTYHIQQCINNYDLNQQQQLLSNQIIQEEIKANIITKEQSKTENFKDIEFFWSKTPITEKQESKEENLNKNIDTSQVEQSGLQSQSKLTQFKWEKKIINLKNINIQELINKHYIEVKNLEFDQKQIWFKEKCEQMRIPWTEGVDYIHVHIDNILLNSLNIIQYCNLHKEVKIQIIGDKVQDAGGLLREWMHLCMKEIFHPNTGMFILADTQEITYKINPEAEEDEHIINCFRFLGKILSKSLFERIPINAYFDRSIINYILGKNNSLEDLQYFDEPLYKSFLYLANNKLLDDDFIDIFAVYKKEKDKIHTIELIPNGENILVNNQNKNLYIERQIQYKCVDQVKIFLDAMCEEIYKIIPKDILCIFEPIEFEMILYGVPFINLEDWKQNTQYKGIYSQNSQVVKWFWQVLSEFNQDQLSKLLQYCTGSSRTPIEGFKKLESNRGNYAKFEIVAVEIDKNNPFPKAHTCFNRLELPLYESLQETKKYLYAIVSNDLDGVFGME